MALAGIGRRAERKETDHGYDKTYKQDGRLVHEQWDNKTKYGEFGIVLGDRFTVKVSGNADSIDQLKAAVGAINLAGLEAMKDVGVKKGCTERNRTFSSGCARHQGSLFLRRFGAGGECLRFDCLGRDADFHLIGRHRQICGDPEVRAL